jgi:hypothetical protein
LSKKKLFQYQLSIVQLQIYLNTICLYLRISLRLQICNQVHVRLSISALCPHSLISIIDNTSSRVLFIHFCYQFKGCLFQQFYKVSRHKGGLKYVYISPWCYQSRDNLKFSNQLEKYTLIYRLYIMLIRLPKIAISLNLT